MEFINLTPHEINLVDADGNAVATFVASGIVARAAAADVKVGAVDRAPGIIVDGVNTTFGEPIDLPEPAENVHLLVSIVTAQAAKAHGRRIDDLLVTSGPVRGDDGRIIGCTRFARL